VATLNVRNLFDAFDDPYTHDESTPEKPRRELEALAQTIRQLDADVLALQEVENRGVLERFLEVFLTNLGYRHVVLLEGNDMRGIDVAVVSRAPLGEVRSYAAVRFANGEQGTDRFQRDLLCVAVHPPQGDPFEVWVVHLKSKGGEGDTEPIRLAEAREIRRLVDQRLQSDPQAQFLICGDFNDEWSSRSLQTIVGETGPGQLVSFFESIPADDRITFNQEPYRSMIDFLLYSPAMARRHVQGSYQIMLGELAASGTDHNPVSCRITTTVNATPLDE
jgi:endonuclease/exonuclease/phosphatase family metal-dependent hydrolase